MKIITLIIFLFLTNNASSIEVNFHAWGGSNNINDYIGNLREDLVDYGIDLKHTKISDTESSVNLILSESIDQKSKVDLIWINGENFQKLKLNNLLYGPINDLNNLKFINLEDETIINDLVYRQKIMKFLGGDLNLYFYMIKSLLKVHQKIYLN